jgi:hypothetical protein
MQVALPPLLPRSGTLGQRPFARCRHAGRLPCCAGFHLQNLKVEIEVEPLPLLALPLSGFLKRRLLVYEFANCLCIWLRLVG